jgi:hypothetical protein
MSDYEKLLKEATPLPWKPEIIDEIDHIPEAQQEANLGLTLHSANVLPQALEALRACAEQMERGYVEAHPTEGIARHNSLYAKVQSAIAAIEKPRGGG